MISVPGKARSRRRDEKQVLSDSLALSAAELDVETGEELRFQRASVSRVRMRELRRGKCFRQDEIDLHGCTIVQARAELREFIVYAQRRGLSCVRVVHGKGRRSGQRGPVIKSGVNTWLRQWDEVLAFCSALPSDGGTGAVYVLLQRG